MVSGLTILFIIIALIFGVVIGFFGARRYMENYLRNNPPITEDMLRSMMMQMGQKPSNRKLHQMMQTMKVQAKKANK
ncbi:YneF family protein [uncultured Limosilactobacillus sp.]|uniref:YneF family protein n=1 Tax=uncultured Limosilactobacillus sp. TaxID=2837629 RepID=UPI0025F4D600|nr:YneF family protein [uncultured Limosilactobacillus sp.]